MIFRVRMLGFTDLIRGEAVVREVTVPDDQLTENVIRNLEIIYMYGQNDIQNVPGCCSVSVGDVIEYGHHLIRICSIGYQKLSFAEYSEYLKVNRDDRYRYGSFKGSFVG